MAEMNRDAIILYLSSVIDLEVAKKMLANRYNIEKSSAEKKIRQLKKSTIIPMSNEYYNPGTEPVFTTSHGFVYLTIMALLFVFGIVFLIGPWIGHYSEEEKAILPIMIITGLVFTGIGCYMLKDIYDEWTLHKSKHREWKRKSSPEFQKKYHEDMVKLNANVPRRREEARKALEEYKADAQRRLEYLKREWNKLNALLDSFYSMNLIPKPYRGGEKLWAIFWLYEWMDSTPDSLSAAYASLQREDIARRMEDRLDYLIDMQEQNIRQGKVLMSRVSKSIEQNKAMLTTLERTEENTRIAAQYSKLSSDYSKASAYFSLANYLKKK